MCVVYICRHGQTEFNKQHRLMGWIDTPLTPEGEQNARDVAAKLKNISFDNIYSSDLGRAFTTAYIITRTLNLRHEIIRTKALREANYGDLAGLHYDEVDKQRTREQRIDSNLAPPSGESLAHMQQRAVDFVLGLQEKTVLLVAHDGTINALAAKYAGIDIGRYSFEHYNDHDYIAKITVAGGTIRSFEEFRYPD